jgi:putative colanic acid biosynthesis glycosyltransferase
MESSSARLCITLHDYWWLTGRCAFLDGCSNYLKGCGTCPTLANYPPVSLDRSGKVILKKRRFLEDFASRISFISPCRYIGQQAVSALGSQFSIDCIHNVVRLPAIDGSELLPNQSPILRILVTAADYSGEHKYSDNFLTRLASLPRTTLTVIGLNPPSALRRFANASCLGRVDAAEVSKQMINADVFVMEGKNEIYPLTLLEALAHGMLTFSVKTPATSEVSEEIGGAVFDSHEDLLDALATLSTSGSELLCREFRYPRIKELQKTLSMDAFVKKHIDVYSRKK